MHFASMVELKRGGTRRLETTKPEEQRQPRAEGRGRLHRAHSGQAGRCPRPAVLMRDLQPWQAGQRRSHPAQGSGKVGSLGKARV